MRKSSFWIVYAIFLVAQLLLSNYFNLTPYLLLSLLPAMVLCIPIRMGTLPAMLVAMGTGLVVDLLSEGIIGLNAAALLPVALLREEIIRLVFGGELYARKEDFCVRRNGPGKVAIAVLMAQGVFLAVYVWLDAAGTQPFWFKAVRWLISLICGLALAMLSMDSLAPDNRK